MDFEKDHILVVGGTGMLAGVCRDLVGMGAKVAVVARRRSRLDTLAKSVEHSSGKIVGIALDYADTGMLVRSLRDEVAGHGRFTAAICWIYSHASEAVTAVADAIADEDNPTRYFLIRGSASVNPEAKDSKVVEELRSLCGIAYHQITLGFKLTGQGSRWLTDEEICSGVMQALRSDAESYVVGTVAPWSKRP